MKHTIKLELPNIFSSIYMATSILSTFMNAIPVDQLDWDEVVDLKTAVKEAVENCILHAYPGGSGPIFVILTLNDQEFIAIIFDTGIGISDVEQARTRFYSTASNHSGLGFTIMESRMDEVNVTSSPEKGTKVTMKKKLHIKE